MTRPPADLPLYVINLPASVDRRASIQRQAAALGIEITLWDAVNGSESHPLFAKVDEKRRMACKGRPFRPGEIGCWASHYLLWQKCVDSGRPMVVFEDDIAIDPRFLDVLRDLPSLPDSVGYFRLNAADRSSSPWVQFGGFVLHRYWRSPFGAFGYYLAPSAAEKFLRHADRWVLPVDDYMDLAWLHGVECLGLKPGLVRTGHLFDSVIRVQSKAKPGIGLFGWLSREAYRAGLKVRWFSYNLTSRLRWRTRPSSS